jgi:hypothetical protein
MKTKTAKKLQSELRDQEASSATRDRRFWTTRIEPGAPTVLGENMFFGTMVMQNHGPGTIVVDTSYRDPVELLPGRVRVMTTHGKVDVATIDQKSALLEFEFMHRPK